MYSIIIHNYIPHILTSEIKNFTQTIKQFNRIENALLFVEEFIDTYIQSLQGDLKYSYLFENPPSGNTFKEGCFVKLYKNHCNKFSVYKRTRYVGYLMNSQEDICHFDIHISKNKHIDNLDQCISQDTLVSHNTEFNKSNWTDTSFMTLLSQHKQLFSKCLSKIDENYDKKVKHVINSYEFINLEDIQDKDPLVDPDLLLGLDQKCIETPITLSY